MESLFILLVDDEDDFRILFILQLKRFLSNLEIEFREASNAETALSLLAGGFVPSVIITDFAMPGSNGLELLERIDTDHPELHNIPRIIISGLLHEEILQEAERLRAVCFEKGVDSKNFFHRISEYIRNRLQQNEQ